MLWLIAIALIIFGLYMVIRGLIEKPRIEEPLEYFDLERCEEVIVKPKKKREIKTGGVVLIGPIPIVFGESRYAFYALILAIILMILSIAFFMFFI